MSYEVTPDMPLSMFSIDQISVPKAAELLAEALREKILQGDMSAGAELPSERELCERAGVSRSTVREALRILGSEGLIEVRLGRHGGSTVLRPSAAAIERSVGIFIRGQRIRLEAVLETRTAIEPACARSAAIHRTEEDLEVLERCQQAVEEASRNDDLDTYLKANLAWHVQVVRAGHNELLIAFISAVAKAVYLESDIEGFSSPEVRDAAINAHRRVMDAIRKGDAEAAARRMERHVRAYAEDVGKVAPPAGSQQQQGTRRGAAAGSIPRPRQPAAKRRAGG